MTRAQKILIVKLLTGHFLRKTIDHRRKQVYVLYDAKVNPLQRLRPGTVETIDKYIDKKIRIWKRSKDGSITLNLNMVRRLHGRCTIKRMYKDRANLDNNGSIYKSRTKKIKQSIANEKNYSLF